VETVGFRLTISKVCVPTINRAIEKANWLFLVIFSYVWLLKVFVKAKLLFAESGLVWRARKKAFLGVVVAVVQTQVYLCL
jgi:hypothetical protein